MKVFTDFHHSSLFYSLQLLFEKRLGWELYRPIGLQWFSQGYWKLAKPYNDSEDTIKQFLGINVTPRDGTPPLNKGTLISPEDSFILKSDSPILHKAVTLEQFKNMKFDLILATHPLHIKPYAELIKKYQPNAKLIHQMGNNWLDEIDFSVVKNLMSSTVPLEVPEGVNAVWYHQEFDISSFYYQPPVCRMNVYSFLNCLKETRDAGLFYKLKALMPQHAWRTYGSQCDDGIFPSGEILANKIREATFIWQVKHTGDGFGHIIHNAYACGRPCIVNKKYYKGMLAEKLLEHGETCLDINKLGSKRSIIEAIKEHSEPEKHDKMCEAAYKKFKELVDYDQEEKELREFFKRLN